MRIVIGVLFASLTVMFQTAPASAQTSVAQECAGLDDEACQVLAQNYLNGSNGVSQDQGKAADLFAEMCDSGFIRSCSEAGRIYYWGLGVQRSPENAAKSAKYYERACNGDFFQACDNAARHYMMYRRDVPRAQRLALKGCESFNAHACRVIETDAISDAEKDSLLAKFSNSCEAGNFQHCAELASLYRGSTFGYDFQTALTLSEKACEGGYAVGCWQAGNYYENTSLDQRDHFKAAEYFEKGCELGHSGACKDKNSGFIRAYNGCVVDADNIVKACSVWGMFLWDGDGIAQDKPAAMTFFRRSCDVSKAENSKIKPMACHMVRVAGDRYP